MHSFYSHKNVRISLFCKKNWLRLAQDMWDMRWPMICDNSNIIHTDLPNITSVNPSEPGPTYTMLQLSLILAHTLQMRTTWNIPSHEIIQKLFLHFLSHKKKKGDQNFIFFGKLHFLLWLFLASKIHNKGMENFILHI